MTSPIALPVWFLVTIVGAIVIHKTASSEPLKALKIRDVNNMKKLMLEIASTLLRKKTHKDMSISFLRSTFSVKINRMGAAIAKVNENIVINSPARPMVTFKSLATKSRMPPIISSAIPTTKETIVKRYTRLSDVRPPFSKKCNEQKGYNKLYFTRLLEDTQ